MMRVRVTLSLIVDAKSPSEAARLVEPVLANMPPGIEQFGITVKGDGYFASNGRRKPSRSRPLPESQYR